MLKIFAAVFALSFATSVTAQEDAGARARARAIEEANRLANAGQLYAARRISDSLSRIAPSDAPDFPDILFARATLAPSVLDASLDYERIAADFAESSVSKESLLRLAQRSLVSGDPAKALDYLQRMLRGDSDNASIVEAQYWRARALLDAHDVTSACDANREALAHARDAHSSLLAEIEAQGFVSCGQPPVIQVISVPVVSPPRPSGSTKAQPSGKRYAVQVSAFNVKRDANALAARLTRKGLDAHVDGSAKPFRVRIGHYSTYGEAAKALRDLKKKGISGFVSESDE